MKILLLCVLTIGSTFAEPPVNNRYLPPQQGFGVSSPSQSYGAPSGLGFGAQRQTDAVFGSRPSSTYGAPSFNSRSRPSSQYGAPRSQSPTNQYLPPSQGSQFNSINYQPSSQYNAPSSQYNAPSSQYNAPSTQYNAPSTKYGAPSSRYSAPSSQYNTPSSQYNAPSSQYNAPSSQYNAPSSQYSAPSTKYGAPSQNSLQAPSNQYGAPNQFSEPLTQYGAPSLRNSAPSQQYGAPGGGNQYSQNGFGPSSRGVDRGYLPPGSGYAGDEDGSGEPANYSFEYMVKDEPSGNDFGHRESRMGDRAEGLYYILLPDGRKQTVEYEADQNGYKPRISYEDTGLDGGYGRSQSGYDNQGGY